MWYKNITRRDEIKLLMHGLSIPSHRVCSATPLPTAQLRPTSPPPLPVQPLLYLEVEDTVGEANVRGKPPPILVPPALPITTTVTSSTVTVTAIMPTELVVPSSVSRTTQWRQQKKASTSSATTAATVCTTATTSTTASNSGRAQTRKQYSCRICGKAASSPDHSQFQGQRYCPRLYPGLSKEEWLVQRRAEAKAKAAARRPPNQD